MERDKQIQVLILMVVKTMEALTKVIPESDPILWHWAAGVEMEARQFIAVPVIPEKKGKKR